MSRGCVICGKRFTPTSSRTLTCSPACKKKRKKASNAEYHLKHGDKLRAERRRRRYQITGAEFNAMLSAQGNACAICSKSPFKPAVDHDHTTGETRALLCGHCNLMLGHAKDNPDILVAAAMYLHSFTC